MYNIFFLSELGRIKALHTEQCNDLETQLHRLKSDKVKLDEENSKLRTSLKVTVISL